MLRVGEVADSLWGCWRAEGDGWSPSGERRTEQLRDTTKREKILNISLDRGSLQTGRHHPPLTYHTWPVGAPVGPRPGRDTEARDEPWPEEGPQTSASLHHSAASSKRPGRDTEERRYFEILK